MSELITAGDKDKQAILAMQQLNNEMRKLVVFTDCEPDDYFAIFLLMSLFNKGRFDSIKFVVSCWTEPAVKAQLLKTVLARHNYHPDIYYGNSTNRQYDLKPLLESFAITAADADTAAIPRYTADVIHQADTILLLAPPVDLLECYRAEPTIFQGKQCALYGSFNVRSLIEGSHNGGAVTADETLAMFHSFQRVIWYETYFATGSVNSFTDADTLTALSAAYPEFPQLVSWWNGPIRAKHEKVRQEVQAKIKLEAESGNQSELLPLLQLQQQLALSNKLCSNIDNCPHQFVNADPGVVAFIFCGSSWLTAEPCQLELGSVTKLTVDADSNILVVQHHGHDAEVRNEQVQQYRNILGLSV